MEQKKQHDQLTQEKTSAAHAALQLVKDGMVLGLGSGSTVKIFMKLLAEKVKREGLKVYIVSSSYDTSILAATLGLIEVSLNSFTPDLSIDGADTVFPDKSLIKGGGGCLLREKLVNYYAREYVIIVDHTKLRAKLDGPLTVPIEVHPMSYSQVVKALRETFNAESSLRVFSEKKLGPAITDNGGFLLDATLNWSGDMRILEEKLKSLPGVLETGVFAVKKPSKIFVGRGESYTVIE